MRVGRGWCPWRGDKHDGLAARRTVWRKPTPPFYTFPWHVRAVTVYLFKAGARADFGPLAARSSRDRIRNRGVTMSRALALAATTATLLSIIAAAPGPSTGAGAASATPEGNFSLTRAGGRPLPYAFTADLGTGTVSGSLLSGKLFLHPDGTYDADLDVKVNPGLLAHLPGIPADGIEQVVHDKGSFSVKGGTIQLEPAGTLTKHYDALLKGQYQEAKIAFTEAQVRSKGERYVIDLTLQRAP